MSKHTPAPWQVNRDDEFAISNEDWGGIGVVYNEPAENKALMIMAKANARLIAAAPELLEVLEKVTLDLEILAKGEVGPDDKCIHHCMEARRAMAKAKGEA